jgi:ribosomal protein S18 acetylase RimI-like enzyme
VEYFYDPEMGYLVWRVSTGENVEMLFVEAATMNRGLGRKLYQRFVKILQGQDKEPYHSVFAFRLGSNEVAKRFYDKMEWTQVDLGQSIYRDDHTVLMWITWQDLIKNLGANDEDNT